MTTPTNGYVPAEFLAPLDGATVVAERNTAAAFNRLRAAHPEVHINAGLAAAYWTRQLDIDIHEGKVAGITDKGLSPNIGASPHGLGIRLNIGGVTPAVAAQFGFSEYNSYTFTYTGTPSWDQATGESGLSLIVVAQQVIKGLWGNGPARVTALKGAGYDPVAVQAEVNALLGITPPAPAPTAPSVTPTPSSPANDGAAPTDAAPPASTSNPAPVVSPPAKTPPTNPVPATPIPKAPIMTAPKPLASAQLAADAAKLDADASQLASVGTSGAPLAGLLAGKPVTRKRVYYLYAAAALVVSCGSDVVVYGVVPTTATEGLIKGVGLATSILLKIGAAFGFVAASNVK